jgi:dTDP-4-dehydrorhamnose reductase
MRVFVAGSRGQVARALVERAGMRHGVVVGAFGRPEFDLAAPSPAHAETIAAFAPDVIVNAAAWTAVDKAESEEAAALRLNAEAPGELAAVADRLGVPFLHLSTDYVFAGDKPGPYVETDATGPLGAYGRTKLAGEQAVAAAAPRHLILRTAWVHSPWGANFVRTMLRLAETRDELGVVADQRGAPTYAPDIADALLDLSLRVAAHDGPWGVYHLASAGECVWADFAERVFARSAALGGPSARVRRITTADYPTPARRPANSRLDCGRLLGQFGLALPDWTSGSDRCVERLIAKETAAA